MTFPDPSIRDAECTNFVGRIEDRYNQGDLTPDHPTRDTRVDPLGYGRWTSAYVVKRANGMDHETATRAVLDEIAAAIPQPGPGPQPWPRPAPSRDAICRVRVGFQGLTISTRQYGAIPAFGPETTTLEDDDLDRYVDQCLAAGFTHTEIAVSWQYVERDYAYPVPGRDLTGDLPELRRRIERMLARGATGVLVNLAGDGESNPAGGYNDPQGWTYGRGWLMANFERIVDACDDLNDFIVWCPGYDGVWYGWKDGQSVKDWFRYARQVIGPRGHLAIEWAAGLCHLGDGATTYQDDAGQCVDVFLQEFPVGPLPSSNPDQIWQIAARELGPAYRRPPEQPAADDEGSPFGPGHPKFYAQGDTPRGPRYVVAYEYDTWAHVRGLITPAQVHRDGAYLAGVGYLVVC